MTKHEPFIPGAPFAPKQPVNVSRRNFLKGAAAGSFVLGVGLPIGRSRAQEAAAQAQQDLAPGTRVPAFLEIRPDNTVRLQSPFAEGGQGIFTAMAQLVGEELDSDPEAFEVVIAPAGPDYTIMYGGNGRITGGSQSVRFSHEVMRKLGALARDMLLQAGATQLEVDKSELTTEPGHVVHQASGRRVTYGQLAPAAMDLPVPDPETISVRDRSDFRYIGQPLRRVDVYEKSTGKAEYTIDMKIDGMLHAAVQHAPRLGLEVGTITNRAEIEGKPGVHSVHELDGAVAVVAERWWTAKRAAEGLIVDWYDPGPEGTEKRYMPADFSTDAFRERLMNESGDGLAAEEEGDVASILSDAENVIEATYYSQYVQHAQLEPPSTLARFNDDGSLDIWLPNQAPEQFQAAMASITGLDASQINVHSQMLGGFFGRHFLYQHGNPYPQAIQLARETGRPIKLIWSREEEFIRDPMRPMAVVRLRAAVDAEGMPSAMEIVSVCEGPTEGMGTHDPDNVDPMAVEGLTGKAYAIPNKRIAQVYVQNPTMIAYWRSVGNSMNDFFFESMLDEVADAGGQDPVEMRLKLLEGNQRLTNLLQQTVDFSGGWQRGPYTAEDGTVRARGVAMASPFGTEACAIAEVSLRNGFVKVHNVWESLDPGRIINPAIIEAQVKSAAALGLSQVLMEETAYKDGQPVARNYDLYRILPPDQMPRVHVNVVESGADIGGVGEPGLPAVPPAVANALSHLVGRRIRSMPLSHLNFDD